MSLSFLVATAGHIDHGKSSLVKALTGTDPDRLPEEKERGITILPGYAHTTLSTGQTLSFVDVPGHERFLNHMIQGANGIQLVVLVIAADDGIMPQTLEHLEVARLMGAQSGLVVLSKTDLVEPDWLDLVEEDIREKLKGSFLDGQPILRFSAQLPELFETFRTELGQHIIEASASIEQKTEHRMPALAVDRVLSVAGRGLVVTGTLPLGTLKRDEKVRVLPGDFRGKVRELQVHNQTVEEARGPTRLALNIAGINHTDVSTGALVLSEDCPKPGDRVWIASFQSVRWLDRDLSFPIKGLLHSGTLFVEAQIQLLHNSKMPDWKDPLAVRIRMKSPVPIMPGAPFIFRVSSSMGQAGATLGGGTLLLKGGPARRARSAKSAQILNGLLSSNVEHIVSATLELHRYPAMSIDELTDCLGYRSNYLRERLLESETLCVLESEQGTWVYAPSLTAEVSKELMMRVQAHHKTRPQDPGPALAELREQLSDLAPGPLLQTISQALIEEGKLIAQGPHLSSSDHQAKLPDELNTYAETLLSTIEAAGLGAPHMKELAESLKASEEQVKEALAFLYRTGRLERISPEYFVPSAAHGRFVSQIQEHLEKHGTLTIADSREITGLSRKYLVPLLSDLDARHITRRSGTDARVAHKAGL